MPGDLASRRFRKLERAQSRVLRPPVATLPRPMPDVSPLRFLLAFFAGIVNRNQPRIVDYLVEENRILKQAIRDKRLRFDDDQRRRLAILGQALGRDLLDRFASIVTPDTIMKWHRLLVAMKWSYDHSGSSRPGRKRVMAAIEKLVVKMARENATWGFKRIQGALAAVGYRIARSTVAKILERNGLPPSSDRRTSWATFLKAHAEGLAAADFLNVEVWTLRGLRTFMVLFGVRLATRKVEVLGITDRIDAEFSTNAARNLVDPDAMSMRGVTHLIVDRDGKFTPAFKRVLKHAAVQVVLTPAGAPDCNAIAERIVGTLRRELLDRMIFFGESSLRQAVNSFVEHYHAERPRQSFDNEILEPGPEVGRTVGRLTRRDRLGGLLRYYHRAA